ncbi:protein FAM90A16-like [Acomys russatus]|uniref:protein FAM90A16-like n=1 Tax=Acomys russatus TaxID=60746 RepID=UPI0021E21FD0|nr:protein FAM90A16-like [Acomys russatus]
MILTRPTKQPVEQFLLTLENHSRQPQKMESLMKTQGAFAAPRAQGKPRRPWAQKVPPPEEENPRMKCRECGSFGHTEKSKRCPIKCGRVIVIPQPHTKMPVFSPGITKKYMVGLVEATARKPPGRQLCLGNPAKQSFDASCILPSRHEGGQNMAVPGVTKPVVFRQNGRNAASENLDQKLQRFLHQHPAAAVPKRNGIGEVFHRASKVQGPSGKTQPSQHPALHQDTQNPKLSFWAPRNKASRHFPEPSQSVRKKPRVSSPNRPGESDARTVLKVFPGSPSPPIGNRLELKAAAEMSKEITAQKQMAPPESTAFLEEGEAAGSQVPRSVLYEDLQVSSSSEDSDGE